MNRGFLERLQRGDGYGYHLTPFTNLAGGAGQAVA